MVLSSQVISFKESREVNGYDFDEDLSELEDQGQARNDDEQCKKDCECGGEYPEYDCQFKGDDIDEDNKSERSYDGSDADYYYELKVIESYGLYITSHATIHCTEGLEGNILGRTQYGSGSVDSVHLIQPLSIDIHISWVAEPGACAGEGSMSLA